MSTPKKFVCIGDDYQGDDTSLYIIPDHYEGCVESVLVSSGQIQSRIMRLARDIAENIESKSLVMLCVLKGGHQFFNDLLRLMKLANAFSRRSVTITLDFIRLKSYENDHSTGTVKVIGSDDLEKLRGKDVLIVEDCIDTGRTMKKLLTLLDSHKPNSVKVAALLLKRVPNSTGYRPDYLGFELPDKFVVGYALDYNEHFRDLDHLCVISDHGRKAFAS